MNLISMFPFKVKGMDLFDHDVKRVKIKLRWNLIGSTFFASQRERRHYSSALNSCYDVYD